MSLFTCSASSTFPRLVNSSKARSNSPRDSFFLPILFLWDLTGDAAHLDDARAQQKLDEAFAPASTARWMKDGTQEQMNKLRQLLADSPLRYVKAGDE